MLTRLKRWLDRESPVERLVLHLESENARLTAENAGLLDKVLLKEGFSGLTADDGRQKTGPLSPVAGHAFEDDEALREKDEQEEVEQRARLAASDPDYMDVVDAHIEGGDYRWMKVRERAEQMMVPSN